MNLTEKPTIREWPATHYVFVEKVGPFQETARQAWQQVASKKADLAKVCQITTGMALYQIQPQMVYRAGFAVDKKPDSLPEGLKYEHFAGGKYACFVLKGSYSNLPEACGRVFKIVEETKLPQRKDFYIEHYVNDPSTTPEESLVTEILIPAK